MNKRRLLKLADLLEADAKNKKGIKFDLAGWGEDRSGGKKPMGVHCGTAACALGLAALSGAFKRQGLRAKITKYTVPGIADDLDVWVGHERGYDAATLLFDISPRESIWLFWNAHYSGPTTGAKGERAVAKRIRDFVAGKVAPPQTPSADHQ